MSDQFFREEVLHLHRERALGHVVLIHPVSHYVLTALALSILTMLALFLALGDYTRSANVVGVLEPVQGAIKLYAPQSGTLEMVSTRVGQRVKAGEVLLVFATKHDSASGETVEPGLDSKLREQLGTLGRELNGTLKLQDAEAAKVSDSLQAMIRSRDSLRAQLKLQNDRLASAQNMLQRYENLLRSGFVTELLVQQKRDEVIDQQLRAQEASKALDAIDADIVQQKHTLAVIPMRKEVAQVQIGRNILSTQAELSRQQAEHSWSLVAPCDGIVAALTISAKQTAIGGVPLVTIVPLDSRLQATLYVPSRALGFMKTGQRVDIKLDSFPYQKFGLVQGRLESISTTPVARSEIFSGNRLATSADPNEPMYTATVTLSQQTVRSGGARYALRPGMQLDADVELDTRRLYEWLIEPLMTLSHG